ncbi:unnamed protein product [Ceutorhynchus assimilis]|uniref:RRM domain-containing protein n=1 Tax=Ceutorhynchus assimilis TaxID=467358 RepID=A0A9N9MFV0_9CUCU|nr:unnamed protein product [Ceutorhynchus assimilis]
MLTGQERKLFIGMLSKKFSENDVRALFSGVGTIEECTVLRDTAGNSRGCAFITFSTKQSALLAIKNFHQSQTMESCSAPLVVKFADTQKEKEMKRQQQMQANVWNALSAPTLASPPQQYSPVLASDATSLQLLQAMGGSALLQQQLLTSSENLLAPIGVQNLVTLAAMSQPATAATAPLCMANSMANLLSKGAGVERTLTAAGIPTSLGSADLGAYGSLITNATLNAAAIAAAGKQIEGPSGQKWAKPFDNFLVAAGITGRKEAMLLHCVGEETFDIYCSLPEPPLTERVPPKDDIAKLKLNNHIVPKINIDINGGDEEELDEDDEKSAEEQKFEVAHDSRDVHEDPNQKKGPDGCNLFIYHLPQEFTDTDLASTFLPFGPVISAKVFIDKQTNLSKCFGFVSFDNASSAQQAIAAMNGFQIGWSIRDISERLPKLLKLGVWDMGFGLGNFRRLRWTWASADGRSKTGVEVIFTNGFGHLFQDEFIEGVENDVDGVMSDGDNDPLVAIVLFRLTLEKFEKLMFL